MKKYEDSLIRTAESADKKDRDYVLTSHGKRRWKSLLRIVRLKEKKFWMRGLILRMKQICRQKKIFYLT